jgi:hypothetical protein
MLYLERCYINTHIRARDRRILVPKSCHIRERLKDLNLGTGGAAAGVD